jgi:hypothetical protein
MNFRARSPWSSTPLLALLCLAPLPSPDQVATQTWALGTVDEIAGGQSTGLRINHSGVPCAGYATFSQGAAYAEFIGGQWVAQYIGGPLSPAPAPLTSASPAANAGRGPADPARSQIVNVAEAAFALAPDDHPAFVMTNSGDTKVIKFTERIAGVWTTLTPIDAGGGERAALVFDAAGNPCVAYSGCTSNYGPGTVCRFATRVGGVWSIDTVDAEMYSGYRPSIAFGADGEPSVLYNSGSANLLKFAHRSAGEWTAEVLDTLGDAFAGELAYSADGDAHVAYRRRGSPITLMYATRHAGVWTKEVVDAVGQPGDQAGLALDSGGEPHIAYRVPVGGMLRYAARSGGIWHTSNVDASGTTGYVPSITLDAYDRPFIIYQDWKYIDGRPEFALDPSVLGVGVSVLPSRASLGVAWPQPLRLGGIAHFALKLPAAQRVTLTAYDLQGRAIATRDAQPAAAGFTTLDWKLPAPGAGLYFVRARGSAGAEASTRVLVLE